MRYQPGSQSIAWFKDLYRDGRLVIKPPYQRRPVWQNRQKATLIETVLLKLPIPEIYVHVTIDDEGMQQYAVVDGQQRIRAILQFIGADKDEGEQDYNRFCLEPLDDANSPHRGRSFDDLTTQERKEFYSYVLAVREIYDATDEAVRGVFTRLNKFLTKLNDQELRNATFSGPFVRLASQLAEDEFWADAGIVSPMLIRRMKDIEFVSELLIGVIDGPQAGKASVIDEYYQRFEDDDDEFMGQADVKRRFARTLSLVQRLLPDIKDTRWKNRTDLYSLFVAIAHVLRTRAFSDAEDAIESMRGAICKFADQVDAAIGSSEKSVSSSVRQYADAHEKGSNDKSRRAARHEAILTVIEKFSQERKIGKRVTKMK